MGDLFRRVRIVIPGPVIGRVSHASLIKQILVVIQQHTVRAVRQAVQFSVHRQIVHHAAVTGHVHIVFLQQIRQIHGLVFRNQGIVHLRVFAVEYVDVLVACQHNRHLGRVLLGRNVEYLHVIFRICFHKRLDQIPVVTRILIIPAGEF